MNISQTYVQSNPTMQTQDPGAELQKRLATLGQKLKKQNYAYAARQLDSLNRAIGGDPSYEDWIAAGIERVIRPESIMASFNRKAIPGRMLRFMEWLRNALVLAPLTLTWLGISQATAKYESLLASDKSHIFINQSFLYLWQQGFNGTLAPAFILSDLALIDFLLLVGILLLTAVVAWQYNIIHLQQEREAEENAEELTEVLGEATLYLIARQRQRKQQQPPQDMEAIVRLLFEVTQEFKRVSEEFLREMAEERRQRGDVTAFLQGLKEITRDIVTTADMLKQSNRDLETLLQSIVDPIKEIPQLVLMARQATGLLHSVAGSLGQLVGDHRNWQQELLERLREGFANLQADQSSQSRQLQTMLQSLLEQIAREQRDYAGALQTQLDTAIQNLLAEQRSLSRSLVDTADTLEDATRNMGVAARELIDATKAQEELLKGQQIQGESQKELIEKLQNMSTEIRQILTEVRQSGPELHSLAVDLEKFVSTLRALPDLLKKELLTPLATYSNAALNVEKGSEKLTEAASSLVEAAHRADDVINRFQGNGHMSQP